MNYHTELQERRATLVEEFARFKKCAAILVRKNAVGYSREHGCYYIHAYGGHRVAALKLMKLQRLIAEQNMLLLELEHSIRKES